MPDKDEQQQQGAKQDEGQSEQDSQGGIDLSAHLTRGKKEEAKKKMIDLSTTLTASEPQPNRSEDQSE